MLKDGDAVQEGYTVVYTPYVTSRTASGFTLQRTDERFGDS